MKYNIAIIGAGPGGLRTAFLAKKYTDKIAILERDQVGGICLNKGCIPTKTLINSANLIHKMNKSEEIGITSNYRLNLQKIRERVQNVVNLNIKGTQFKLKQNKIDLITTKKIAIDSPNKLVINDKEELHTKYIIIATGSKIKNINFQNELIITSDEAVKLKDVPKTLGILGGGYIGCELAMIYNAFGSNIKIIDIADRILPNSDEDASKLISRVFKKLGIEFYLKNSLKNIVRKSNQLELKLDQKTLVVDKLLVSIGRKPNLEIIENSKLNIEIENNAIKTNKVLQTNYKNIYAIGDIRGEPFLAHKAYADSVTVIENIFNNREKTYSSDKIPAVIYTQPEIATIGETKNFHKTEKLFMKSSSMAHAINSTEGLIKIFLNEHQQIIGALLVTPYASEIIHTLQLAILYKMNIKDLSEIIFAHPTISESIHDIVSK